MIRSRKETERLSRGEMEIFRRVKEAVTELFGLRNVQMHTEWDENTVTVSFGFQVDWNQLIITPVLEEESL